jgi:hypothetical protein
MSVAHLQRIRKIGSSLSRGTIGLLTSQHRDLDRQVHLYKVDGLPHTTFTDIVRVGLNLKIHQLMPAYFDACPTVRQPAVDPPAALLCSVRIISALVGLMP